MNETLISLVVPVYNAGPWLAPCLASITAQTHTAWECILSDDGSTDGSAEACDAAAAADPRFRVVHRPNSGPNAARQAGLEAAKGEWLCFIDADDLLRPEYLARLLALAGEQGAQAAACGVQRFSDGCPPPAPAGEAATETLTADQARLALLWGRRQMAWGLWNKLYHRSLFADFAFPVTVRHNEDLLANWRLLGRCARVAVTEWPGYGYRQLADSASHRLPGAAALADHLTVADTILAEAAGTPLAEAARAFHYEKLLFVDSMVLRQPTAAELAPLHKAVRARLRAGFWQAMGNRRLALWLKLSALLTLTARPLYRALCRRFLPGGR